jgi:hypothetical protein
MSHDQTTTSTDLVPSTNGQPTRYDESISAGDLALPRLQVAHSSTRAVQEGLVPFGALFVNLGADDPAPETLFTPGQTEKGPVVYLLAKRSVWAYRDEERFVVVGVDQLDGPVPKDAVRGYEFAALLPAFDSSLPCSWLVKSTALPCAQRMMTVIARARAPHLWSVAFELSTLPRASERGRWYIPVASKVPAKPKHVQAAREVAGGMLGLQVE